MMVAEAGTFVINPSLYQGQAGGTMSTEDFIPVTGLVRINQSVWWARKPDGGQRH